MGSDSPELNDWVSMCIGFSITIVIIVLLTIVVISIILYTRHRSSAQRRDLDAELHHVHEDLDRCHLDREIFDAERNEGDLEFSTERLRVTIQVSCEDEDEIVPVQCEAETSEDASSDDSELSLPGSLHSDGGSVRWDSDFDAFKEECRYSDSWSDSQSSSSSGLESEFSPPCTISSGRESSDSAISSAEEDLPVSDRSDNEEQRCSDMNYIAKVEAESINSANFQPDDSNRAPSLTNSLSNDSFQSTQSPPLSDLFRSDQNQSRASLTDHLSEVLSQNSNQSSSMNDPLHDHSKQCPQMANSSDEESPPVTLPLIDGCNQIQIMTMPFNPDSIQSPSLTDLLDSNLSQTLPLTDFLNHDSSQGPILPVIPSSNSHRTTQNLSLSDPLNNDSNQSPTLTDRLHEALNQHSAITIPPIDDSNQSLALNDPLQNDSKQHPSSDENPPLVGASNDSLNRNQPLTNPLNHNSSQRPYFADLLSYGSSQNIFRTDLLIDDSNQDSILTNTFPNSNQRPQNPSFIDLLSDDSRRRLPLFDSHNNGSNQSSCSPTLTVPLTNPESPLTEPLDDAPNQISDQISIITESFYDDSIQGSTVTAPFNDDLNQGPQSPFLSDPLNDDTNQSPPLTNMLNNDSNQSPALIDLCRKD